MTPRTSGTSGVSGNPGNSGGTWPSAKTFDDLFRRGVGLEEAGNASSKAWDWKSFESRFRAIQPEFKKRLGYDPVEYPSDPATPGNWRTGPHRVGKRYRRSIVAIFFGVDQALIEGNTEIERAWQADDALIKQRRTAQSRVVRADVEPKSNAVGAERAVISEPYGDKADAEAKSSRAEPEGSRDSMASFGAETDAQRRDRVFKHLKREMLSQLVQSTALLAVLEELIATDPAPGQGSSDQDRAALLRDRLMTMKFEESTDCLLSAFNRLDDADDRRAIAALQCFSGLLVPWLYVVAKSGHWPDSDRAGPPDSLLDLPAGIECFAEIIRAGIDMHSAEFHSAPPLPTELSPMALSSPSRQGSDPAPTARLDEIRANLQRALSLDNSARWRDPAGQDEDIERELSWQRRVGNRRHYYLATVHLDSVLRVKEEKFLTMLKQRYKSLVVIRLNFDFRAEQHDLFKMISRLFGRRPPGSGS